MTVEEYIHQYITDLSDFNITVEDTAVNKLCRLIKVKDIPLAILKREVKYFHVDEINKFIFAQVETLEEFLLKRVEILEQKIARLEQLQRVNMSGECV